MQTGAITQYIDVAQVVLYAFWVFFAGLIFYIRQEDRREGYPLENDKTGELGPRGFPFIPDPKTFILAHGHGTVSVPNRIRDRRPIAAQKIAPFAGAPLEPTGNPLVDGVGPAAWAERSDRPDVTMHGDAKIVPLRAALAFHIAEEDPDPRGFEVVGCDKQIGGTISDVWVDQSEQIARYFEVTTGGGRKVLLPVTFTLVDGKQGIVYVHALRASQFEGVPVTKHPEQVTMLEEDKICGYYGGGTLYATPQRSEPLL